ncbi:hypothetical protein [Shouchella miscanthi]|uniref:Sigma-70 family RNA polymerase sigma factor n=1 Tax=Shouchella miscanthi TaxID=2598861 RepID=A0ABU6NQ07_9BACI|nr:hypothetical protein [Shouchella miscanthi]
MTLKTVSTRNEVKLIETTLRKYTTYQAGKLNLKKQLYAIIPSTIELKEIDIIDRNNFIIQLNNENEYILAMNLYKDLLKYSLITESIDIAVEQLDLTEFAFVQFRYFENKTMKEISIEMGYGEKHLFNLRRRLLGKLLISLKSLTSQNL